MPEHADFNELKELFQTNARALEMLFLIVGAKPCVRLMCYEEEIPKLEKFCAKKDLWMETSDFKIHLVKDKSKANYSNKGLIIPLNSPFEGQVAVYISKNDMLVRHAKEHERKQDSYKLGLDLGYPECCCEFFIENRKQQEKRSNDYVMPCLRNSTLDVFPYQMNNTLRYFDRVVLPHFPCSYECSKSAAQAKHFMQIIDAYTDLGSDFMGALQSPIVYSENHGVYRLKDAKVNGLEISYNGIEGTTDGELFELLDHADKIVIKERNFLKVYKGEALLHEIHNPDFAVLLFE
jgi:hypothetical protein